MKDKKNKSDVTEKEPVPCGKAPVNMLLAAGLVFIILGLVLLGIFVSKMHIRQFILRPIVVLLLGSVVLYWGITRRKKAWTVFAGLSCIMCGALVMLHDSGVLAYSLYELWPSIVIICGVSLFPAGYYHCKRFHPVYAVPAAVLCFMGLFFLLFSLDIINESFSAVVAAWWPLLFVFGGIVLIVKYYDSRQKKAVPASPVSGDTCPESRGHEFDE